MTVLFDALLVNGWRSGVEVSVVEAARHLCSLAPDEVVVACRRGLLRAEEWLARARVVVAPVWAVGRAGRIAAEQIWLPRVARRHCLLHGPAYVLPLAWRGPAVVTVYDLVALTFPQWTKPANVMHYRAVVPPSVRRAEVVVVPSQVVAAEVTEVLGAEEERVRVVPLGVREVFFQQPNPEDVERFRARWGLERPFFAVVGNIEPKKNVAAIVRAFEVAAVRLADHELVIAGRPAWRYKADLAAIRNSPVRSRIRLLGRVSDEDLRCLYAACTALVQWSLYEGFGLVPLEAMACGAAVIVSNGGALAETAGPGARVVPLAEPADLAEAMVEVAGDEQKRRALARSGQRWARRFTWDVHAQRLLEIYREVA